MGGILITLIIMTKKIRTKKFPIDAHRILNYQSCRGLEAWTIVLWNLDTNNPKY